MSTRNLLSVWPTPPTHKWLDVAEIVQIPTPKPYKLLFLLIRHCQLILCSLEHVPTHPVHKLFDISKTIQISTHIPYIDCTQFITYLTKTVTDSLVTLWFLNHNCWHMWCHNHLRVHLPTSASLMTSFRVLWHTGTSCKVVKSKQY